MATIKPGSKVTLRIDGNDIYGVHDVEFGAASRPDVTYQLPLKSTTMSCAVYVRPADARRLVRMVRRVEIADRLAAKHSRGLRNLRPSRHVRLAMVSVRRQFAAL